MLALITRVGFSRTNGFFQRFFPLRVFPQTQTPPLCHQAPLPLLSHHALSHALPERVHFHGGLSEGAAVAAPHGEDVPNEAARDALLLPHLLPQTAGTDEVGQGYELDQTADEARLANLLGDLADRVAGHEVGDDADGAVVEAAAEAVLELVGHCAGWRWGFVMTEV